MAKKYIYNSDGYSYEDAKEYLENCEIMKHEKISDSDIWDEVNLYNQIAWEDFCTEFKNVCESDYDYQNPYCFILTGSVGVWAGNYSGYKILNGLYDLINVMCDNYDYVELYQENGQTWVRLSHHDGTHCMKLMQLNQKGLDALDRQLKYCEMDDFFDGNNEPVNGMFKNVKLYNLIYGG